MIRVMKVSILGLLAACAMPLRAQQAVPLDCLLEPNRVIDVSSAVRGVLSAVDVDRGDLVERDQVVARLDSSVEQAAMELAQARARANAEVQADQINADPNTTAFQQFLGGTGSMVSWWGDVGSNAKTSDSSVIGDVCGFDILPGSDDVYNHATGQWETLPDGPNYAPNMAYIGWGIYVMARVDSDPLKQKAAWSAAAHLGGKDLSLWCAAYPSGFQPYRNSHFNIEEWVAAGYDEGFITDYLASQSDSYNHPNAAIEPRIPGIFQYYSVAEDELAKIYAGQFDAQTGADNIAAAWERITDQIGREQQIALYKASLGV